MADPVKSSSSTPAPVSTPAPAANSQKQNEKKARPTLEERLQELFRSTTLVRREFLVGGTKVAVRFNPRGAMVQLPTTPLPIGASVVVGTANEMSNALKTRFSSAIIAAGLTHIIMHRDNGVLYYMTGPGLTEFYALHGNPQCNDHS